MSALVTELDWTQRTALRLNARQRALEAVEKRRTGLGQALITRPLQPADLLAYGRRRDDPREHPARYWARAISARQWQRVIGPRQLYPDQAVAIWGCGLYRPESNIDGLRFGTPAVTLAEIMLAELTVATDRRRPTQVRRRSGFIDPPIVYGPLDAPTVSVLSDLGIAGEEPFALLGVIVEAAGRTVVPVYQP